MIDIIDRVIALLSDSGGKYVFPDNARFIASSEYVDGKVPTMYLTSSLTPNLEGFDAGEVADGGYYWFNPRIPQVCKLIVSKEGNFSWIPTTDCPMYVFDSDGAMLGYIRYLKLNANIESLRQKADNVSFSELVKTLTSK